MRTQCGWLWDYLETYIFNTFEPEEGKEAIHIPKFPLPSFSLSFIIVTLFCFRVCAMKPERPKGDRKPILKRQNESCSMNRDFHRGALFKKPALIAPAPHPPRWLTLSPLDWICNWGHWAHRDSWEADNTSDNPTGHWQLALPHVNLREELHLAEAIGPDLAWGRSREPSP